MSSNRTYKHLAVFKIAKNGTPTYVLACEDKVLCDFFDHWAYQLARKQKANTVKAYVHAVADLLNYIHELSMQHGGPLTRYLMSDALSCYESYLVFGVESNAELAASAAKALGSRSLGGASIELHFAGVNKFIEQSESLAQSLQSLEDAGLLLGGGGSTQPLVKYGYVDTTAKVHAAIKQSSWLAGCISGGYKRLKKQGLGKKSKHQNVAYTDFEGGDDKTFPYDLAVILIKKARSLRDKVLWSHICATGCRISEALTTLIDDIIIDVNFPANNRIMIIDPDTRRNVLKKYLSEEQINKLPHKGRNTELTYPIEPFASLFWMYLEQYLNEERIKDKRRSKLITHRFLYRKNSDGEPCVASYQSLWEIFHAIALELTGKSYGFHALRHMYAYYLVNFAPNPQGSYGFDLKTVADFLGHSSISSTKRYARRDAELLKIALSAMNYERNNNPHFTINNARIAFLEKEIERLKNQVELSQEGRKAIG